MSEALEAIRDAVREINLPLVTCITMRRTEYDAMIKDAKYAPLMGSLSGVQVCAVDTMPDGIIYILEYTNGNRDLVRVDGLVTRIKHTPIFSMFGAQQWK